MRCCTGNGNYDCACPKGVVVLLDKRAKVVNRCVIGLIKISANFCMSQFTESVHCFITSIYYFGLYYTLAI